MDWSLGKYILLLLLLLQQNEGQSITAKEAKNRMKTIKSKHETLLQDYILSIEVWSEKKHMHVQVVVEDTPKSRMKKEKMAKILAIKEIQFLIIAFDLIFLSLLLYLCLNCSSSTTFRQYTCPIDSMKLHIYFKN